MEKHIHADLIEQYAQDAMTTEEPWKLWECFREISGEWNTCNEALAFFSNKKYRRKPRTIRIGEFDVPEPLRVEPNVGSYYRVPSLISRVMFDGYHWSGDSYDKLWLRDGLIHLSEEAAVLHARAIISLSKEK